MTTYLNVCLLSLYTGNHIILSENLSFMGASILCNVLLEFASSKIGCDMFWNKDNYRVPYLHKMGVASLLAIFVIILEVDSMHMMG